MVPTKLVGQFLGKEHAIWDGLSGKATVFAMAIYGRPTQSMSALGRPPAGSNWQGVVPCETQRRRVKLSACA